MYSLSAFAFITIIIGQLICGSYSQCDLQETCGKCISYPHETCVWCSAAVHNGSRCAPYDVTEKWCQQEIYNPVYKLQILDNRPLSVDSSDDVVQLTPQHIKVKIRPGQQISFNISYKPFKDYPLDVYYLMDNSYTMKRYREELRTQGEKIPFVLSNVTNNVRLGVGSFVEKPALPYARISNNAYTFKHHLSLSSDMKSFKRTVDNTLVKVTASNLDDPEAGFDALMQIMVCEKPVGWRKDAWRIIVFCTDSTYHSAGDGKMVGAFKPNDMKCHLEKDTYTMDLDMDYPSVSQINKIASNNSFTIIFAATRDAALEYSALSARVKGSRYAELKKKSNVVNIIKEEYQKLLQSLQLNVNIPENIQLSLNPDCSKINNCEVKYKEPISVQVTFKVKSCLDEMKRVEIKALGLSDTVYIDVETDCKCSCEENRNSEVNSRQCNGSGTYQCGICKCNDNRYGETCECITSSSNDDLKGKEKCKLNNDAALCSGRGICRCGKCLQCMEGFYGDFCELEEIPCLQRQGRVCGDHGVCVHGQCYCDDHWTGDDCSCSTLDLYCIAPHSKEVCSGNGRCVCGNCVCDKKSIDKNETYSGIFCDYCEECAAKRCEELNVLIDKYCTKHDSDITCNKTDEVDIIMETKNELLEYSNSKWCSKTLEDGCSLIYKFKYLPTSRKLQLMVQREEDCSPKANLWIAVGSAIGSILLVGILTAIIWKILVDMHDEKEYKKFVAESAAAGWDVSVNPLYIEPETNFINPAFQSSTSSS